MTLFLFLALAAGLMILTVPLTRRRKATTRFDPGSWRPPAQACVTENHSQPGTAIRLGGELLWTPDAHPNPHVLILGGSGTGKTWTMRSIARQLSERGHDCLLIDFHGDLEVPGSQTFPIRLDSECGVNPLEISQDPEGGGPDAQRFEVLEQLRIAFRPMGGLQLALLDSCLRQAYAGAGIMQCDPATWSQPAPHFGDLQAELDRRIKAEPKDTRLQGLRAKLGPAFDFRIFSKPLVPLERARWDSRAVRLDLGKLPTPLQYLAADTVLKLVFRNAQLGEPGDGVSLYLFIDETKLCIPARKDDPLNALNRIATEGRKFGLALVLSSQFVGHVSRDVLVNSFPKILMRVDKTEIAATAKRFRIEHVMLQALDRPGHALVNFANSQEWKEVTIE